jgi:hypothetical protein
LRAREDANGFIKLPRPARLRVGQRVRIALGPFTGLYGIYRGGRRNHDLVELQGRLACRLAIWLLLSRAREEMEAYERKHGKEQT